MLVKSINGKSPSIPKDCYVAENATIVGDVSFGENCSDVLQFLFRNCTALQEFGTIKTSSIG